MLLFACYSLCVSCCVLFVESCLLSVACLSVACCWLVVVWWLLVDVCLVLCVGLLRVACCVLFVGRCLMFDMWRLVFVVAWLLRLFSLCYSLVVVGCVRCLANCLVCVVCCLLFAVCC